MPRTYQKHYEEEIIIKATPQELFAFVDDHGRFSAHMNQSSMMMGGGKMETKLDNGKGQNVGSHITMSGKVFGFNLFLDEVVVRREVPTYKSWETVGEPKLLVVGDYTMALEITPADENSKLKVSIDYNPPLKNKWLGSLFGNFYAKWCVRQMLYGAKNYFERSA